MKLMKLLQTGVLLVILAVSTTACTKVTAGHEGVKVNLLGSEKGVQTETLGVGRYWIGVNEDLFLFPTFTQNYTWTRSLNEGAVVDESISFQTSNGLVVSGDVGISYRVIPGQSATVFQKYRMGINEVTNVHMRNSVRDALVNAGAEISVESVYGKGKTLLLQTAFKVVKAEFAPIGIEVEKLYWVGNLRLPAVVTTSINMKIQATQKAEQRQNEVAQSKAEADKKIEEARGKAESVRINAKAEADAIKIVGAALAQNPALIELEGVKKWNGVLPYYMGGAGSVTPFVNLNRKVN